MIVLPMIVLLHAYILFSGMVGAFLSGEAGSDKFCEFKYFLLWPYYVLRLIFGKGYRL